MALVSRTRTLLIANQIAPKSANSTVSYGVQSTPGSVEVKTVVYPAEKMILDETRPNDVGPRVKRQFVRKHGTTSKMVHESERNLDYCFKKLRQHEFENFLCTLLLPEEARRGAIAIRAFNIEIAQVRDSITDRTIGEMRMQFWRDAVDAMFDPAKTIPRGNPVIAELNNAVEKHQLSKSWLLRVIESRQEHLAEKPYPSLDALEKYAEATVSSINYLLLETLDVRDVRVDHAASHLGKAQGIVTAIRATPFHAHKRRVLLPTDVLIKHGASAQDFIQGKRTDAVKEVTFELASQAHAHLSAGRTMMDHVPKRARSALITSVATRDFLARLRKVHFDPFDSKMQRRNQMLPMRLWWNNFRRMY